MNREPKHLRDRNARLRARYIRDRQWRFMEKAEQHDPLWFCVWNKRDLAEEADEWRDGLITGLEIEDWIARHRDWFRRGRWSEKRYARPIRLTDAGRAALANRAPYDMEPVYGGLVEPGWQCVPAAPRKAAA